MRQPMLNNFKKRITPKNDTYTDQKPADYYQLHRSEMLGFIPPAAHTILEVGCGSGDFGASLKKDRNAEVWGVELIEKPAECAALKLDQVITGNIETDNISLPTEYFDCIICNDVLEHLVDPWRVLRRLRVSLTSDGVLVASIPNIRFFSVVKDLVLNKRWEYREHGVLDRTHLRFFTESSIRELFENSGYQILTLEGINAYAFSWKFSLLNSCLGNGLNDMRFMQFACVARNGELEKGLSA